jgi:hypothetical protein
MKVYNSFTPLQFLVEDTCDESPIEKKTIDTTTTKVATDQLKKLSKEILLANEQEKLIKPLKKSRPRPIALSEFLKESHKIPTSFTLLPELSPNISPLFSPRYDRLFSIEDAFLDTPSTCFLLLKELFCDEKMQQLPRSFYRQAYFLMGNCVERALKKNAPDLREHDLEKIFKDEFKKHSLTTHQTQTLSKFFQIYKFFLTIDTKSNLLVPSSILPSPNLSKQSFENLFKDFEIASYLIALVNSKLDVVQNKTVEILQPIHNESIEKSFKSKLSALFAEFYAIIENDLNKTNLQPIKIACESQASLSTRLLRLQIQKNRINYFSQEITSMLELFSEMDFKNPKTISLPLIHHLIFSISTILEASILTLLTIKPIPTSPTDSTHIIFKSSKHLSKDRPIGYEHNIGLLFSFIPAEYKENIGEDVISYLSFFSNFINSSSKYPDRSQDPYAKFWCQLLNQDQTGLKTVKISQKNEWLDHIRHAIDSAIFAAEEFIFCSLNR